MNDRGSCNSLKHARRCPKTWASNWCDALLSNLGLHSLFTCGGYPVGQPYAEFIDLYYYLLSLLIGPLWKGLMRTALAIECLTFLFPNIIILQCDWQISPLLWGHWWLFVWAPAMLEVCWRWVDWPGRSFDLWSAWCHSSRTQWWYKDSYRHLFFTLFCMQKKGAA